MVSPGQAMREELGPPAHPPAHRSVRSGTGAAQRGGGVANELNHARVTAHRRHWPRPPLYWPRPNRLPAGRRARGAANQSRAWFSNRRRAGGGAGNQARDQPQPHRSPHRERAHTESHRSRSRDQEQERSRAMERAKTPAVSAGRGSVWMFRWGQPRGGFLRVRRVRSAPVISVCVSVCVWWGGAAGAAAGDPPVTPGSPAGAEAAPAHPPAAAADAIGRRPDQPDPPAPPAAPQGQCAGITGGEGCPVHRNRPCCGVRWCRRSGRTGVFPGVEKCGDWDKRLRGCRGKGRGCPDLPFPLKYPVGP